MTGHLVGPVAAAGAPRVRRACVVLLAGAAVLAASCAPKAPPIAPGPPRYPEFV
jgi:hypothetical protein